MNTGPGQQIAQCLTRATRLRPGRPFETLRAMRRPGLLTVERYPPLLEVATTRATQVAALLACAHRATQPDGATRTLTEQISEQTQAVTVLEVQNARWPVRFQGVGFPAVAVHHPPIPHTRRSLAALLRQPPLAPLAAVLSTPQRSLPAGLRAAVTQSAVRLAEALYVRTPAAQLLGAITAIEILVSDPIETYDQMRRRIGALLGREALDQYTVEGVLRARHRYVHQGDPEPARAMVPPAIGLALAALLRYAAAPAFPDKGALLD